MTMSSVGRKFCTAVYLVAHNSHDPRVGIPVCLLCVLFCSPDVPIPRCFFVAAAVAVVVLPLCNLMSEVLRPWSKERLQKLERKNSSRGKIYIPEIFHT